MCSGTDGTLHDAVLRGPESCSSLRRVLCDADGIVPHLKCRGDLCVALLPFEAVIARCLACRVRNLGRVEKDELALWRKKPVTIRCSCAMRNNNVRPFHQGCKVSTDVTHLGIA